MRKLTAALMIAGALTASFSTGTFAETAGGMWHTAITVYGTENTGKNDAQVRDMKNKSAAGQNTTSAKNDARIESRKKTEKAKNHIKTGKNRTKVIHTRYAQTGRTLTKRSGIFYGPSGKEAYYNLDMSRVIRNMKNNRLNTGEYWVRKDGVKMLGDYIMVAADLRTHKRGSIVETSLGLGMVCDTGSFAGTGTALDIAVTW